MSISFLKLVSNFLRFRRVRMFLGISTNYLMVNLNFHVHYQKSSLNATLIEVYEGSHTSDSTLVIAIEFKVMSEVRISDVC